MQNTFFPWQKAQWHYLLQRWQHNNLPHALLFTGIPGLGKKTFAHLFAKLLLCSQSKIQAIACEQCRACQLFMANSHPDFYCIHPEEVGKAIRIDQVRSLIAQVNQTAQQEGQKVIIIEPADVMNTAAANALLKTLEEPVAHTVLLLISHRPGLLPATVRSRCQTILFSPPTQAFARDWLAPQIKAENIDLSLTLAEGAPLRALQLANETGLQQQQKLFNHLRDLIDRQTEPLTMATHWSKENPVDILDGVLTVLSDMMRFKNNISPRVLKDEEGNFLQGLAQRMTSFKLLGLIDFLYEMKRQLILSPSLNTQLLIEDVFCRWQELFAPC